ncbi:winged helix-turn-helix domain-containing protein [Brevundimonas sp. PAMC22021]|uniref:winged helix-turn-helix domain-containing protein n=1 Tax=Brevundimonas sp. PAMC22021 TaxID=2861285 RepID=UPI001C633578|nr:crosslink repair DNA glycosylase YcaQ family protein [Brevundimonas sp. PAMC22021]QYF85809.1 winged helix DNA-binding domain-containing protein [Brevundimonas sp. PAMC22021]
MKDVLTLAETRRVALAAQGFNRFRKGGEVDRLRIANTIARLNLLQVDSVNVLVRAHYMPLYSRLGPYSRELLDTEVARLPRRLFEYWAHEASLLPIDFHPLLRWRMADAARGQGVWSRLQPFATERRGEAEALLDRIAAEGPLAASDLGGRPARKGMWEWSDAKQALEWLFWSGFVASTHRRGSFERIYDLTERALPRRIVEAPTPAPRDAKRLLVERSARALGIATSGDLRDYFRLSPEDARAAISDLTDAGVLSAVQVEGWSQPAYLHQDARQGRRLGGEALLSPFDPLVWKRDRAERLFSFSHRLEIYTPAHRRVHGYYVLPFLMDGAIVARVDLKADRQAGLLRVLSVHLEPGAPAETVERLWGELRRMAGWLGLQDVTQQRRIDRT